MNKESWARFTLRISADTLTIAQIAKVMGAESSGKGRNFWTAAITVDPSMPLEHQFVKAEAYLREHLSQLANLSDRGIELMLGWSPQAPQDGLSVSPELVHLIAQVGGALVIDTYFDA